MAKAPPFPVKGKSKGKGSPFAAPKGKGMAIPPPPPMAPPPGAGAPPMPGGAGGPPPPSSPMGFAKGGKVDAFGKTALGKKDAARDKKMGIKQNSPADKRMDRKVQARGRL